MLFMAVFKDLFVGVRIGSKITPNHQASSFDLFSSR